MCVDLETGAKTLVSDKPLLFGFSLGMHQEGERVWWLTSGGLLRWNLRTRAVVTVAVSPQQWTFVAMAADAPVAAIAEDSGLFVLSFDPVKRVRLTDRTYSFDISRAGAKVAYAHGPTVHVVNSSDGKEVATFSADRDVRRLAYCDDDDALVYQTAGRLHLYRLSTGEVAYPDPTRFAVWSAPGEATVTSTRGALKLRIADLTTSPVTQPPIGPPPVDSRIVMTDANVTIAVPGAPAVALPLKSPSQDEEHVRVYRGAALSPDERFVAVVWSDADPPYRRPDDGNEDEAWGQPSQRACTSTWDGKCVQEFFGEVWELPHGGQRRPGGSKLKRRWQVRFEQHDRRADPRRASAPKSFSGPVAFTHDNTRVLFGFEDGDVMVIAVATSVGTTESLHDAAVVRFAPSPYDDLVMSEDAVGEQRVWTVPH